MKYQVYTDEHLLKILREYAKSFGARNLRLKMKKIKSKPCVNTFDKRFGNWRRALAKAGVPYLYGGRVPSRIPQLDVIDAKYIAGLIDCEGSITRAGRKKFANKQYCIVFVNKNKDIIDYFKQLVGGGRINFNNGTYRLEFRKNEVVDLLPQIYPHLIVKKKEAKYLLDYIKREQRESRFTEPFIPLNLEENLKKYKPNFVPIDGDY